ncbi:hypothetical protein L7F22_068458 [Adiantum nelumboides]|nr:hypothetical protein [Adiantum nelumboides]
MFQDMHQVLPSSTAHSGYAAGGSVFQSMAGYALENHQYMPATMFGGMQDMVPNPMYANIGMQPRFWGTQGQFGVSQGNLGMAVRVDYRWNLSAGAARPNPQGSFHYGQIAVTQTLLLRGSGPMSIQGGGPLRYGLNGVSYATPSTPLKLADYFGLNGVFIVDAFPNKPATTSPVSLMYFTSVISGGYRGFMEIIFQNDDNVVQSYHLDGYAFFVVGYGFKLPAFYRRLVSLNEKYGVGGRFGSGEWTEASRGSYNRIDAVARSTTQVFPRSWTAILVELDNVGMWNLRSELLANWYLGQELYIRVYNPENSIQTEAAVPDNAIYCGLLASKQKEYVQLQI